MVFVLMFLMSLCVVGFIDRNGRVVLIISYSFTPMPFTVVEDKLSPHVVVSATPLACSLHPVFKNLLPRSNQSQFSCRSLVVFVFNPVLSKTS